MNKTDELQVILDIGIALSAERDRNKLFNMIITKSMDITNCDAGTLYLLEDGALKFKIMKTLSMGVDKGSNGEEIDLPPVAAVSESNICSYSAIHRKTLNIVDVRKDETFDFSGPKKYDAMTGYHTQSMMVVPLIDDNDEVAGVLQLINAQDSEGKVIGFESHFEKIIYALGSLTAIAISNMHYQQELKDQMWSFTEAMAAAIDERTPYNASHTRKVAKYSGMIADHINELHDKGLEEEYFDPNRKEQLVMGAFLHDIGKMAVPLEVMNKATRLNGRESEINKRLEIFRLKAKVMMLEGKMSEEWYDEMASRIDETEAMIEKVNAAGFLDDDTFESLKKVLEYDFCGEPFFTENEKECLSIRKGTLTSEERKIMESHVAITKRILDKVHFIKYFQDAPIWAAQHHECLNGRGYPLGLTADKLGVEARIMAVADICDALLATDRPYKKPIPKEKAFAIMRDMAASGNIDGKYVEYLYDCIDV
jgi:HD-GYP domain-containing protein (c-di-GMP phosphodiesterase class II)